MARLCLESPGAFFPPLRDGDETPEFVRWAIDYRCRPREQHDGADLEGVFRQLRPLAALSDAMIEGRVVSAPRSVAISPDGAYEFSAEEVMRFYDAENPGDVECKNCPANGRGTGFAHCIGIVSRCDAIEEFVTALEDVLQYSATDPPVIPVTSPRWYGFWAQSPLLGDRLKTSINALQTAILRCDVPSRPIYNLVSGMLVACDLDVPVHVQLLPPGKVRDGRWQLPPHCGYCGGPRAPRQKLCKICRRTGAWKSGESRHLIGIRPYRAVNVSQ